jgi:hypothetical protein
MQPEQIILPAIATVALGTALLVPLRDDRPGKRATLTGNKAPLRPDFRAVAQDAQGVVPETIPEECVCSTEAFEAADFGSDTVRAEQTEPPAAHLSLRAIAIRLRRLFEAPWELRRTATVPDAPPQLDGESVVTERSFAEQLEALLPMPTVPIASAPTPEEAPPAPLPARIETAEPEPEPRDVHVVAAVRAPFERIVPLTRMPLRPQTQQLTWPLLAPSGAPLDSQESRHDFLSRASGANAPELEPLLAAAYREEDCRGRLLALRAIRIAALPSAYAIFADALHVGSDEERSFAVDALLAMHRPEAITPAFSDRVDAIAAQAALGYVGSQRRADYLRALEPFVDRARIESILGLLAGIVE